MATTKTTAKRKPPSTKAAGVPLPVPAPASGIGSPPKKKGRPSTFNDAYIETARRLCLLQSMTNDELAQFFGVSKATFSKWMHDRPEFSDAIACAKKPADSDVASALFRRALGYTYTEQQAIKIKVNGKETIKLVDVKKHLAGDVTAQSLWLRNRQPQHWKSQPEDSGGETDSISNITVSVQHSPHVKPGSEPGSSSK